MLKRVMSITAALLTTLIVAGCTLTVTPDPHGTANTSPTPVTTRPTPTPSHPVPSYPLNETLIYLCSNARLQVRYTSTDSVQVFYGDWQNLTRSITTGGEWIYRNSEFTWHASGNTGYLEQNGVVVRSNCSYLT